MAKRQSVLTMQVWIDLPVGSNAAEVQQFLREAIQKYSHSRDPKHKLYALPEESYTVRLIKKETTYG